LQSGHTIASITCCCRKRADAGLGTCFGCCCAFSVGFHVTSVTIILIFVIILFFRITVILYGAQMPGAIFGLWQTVQEQQGVVMLGTCKHSGTITDVMTKEGSTSLLAPEVSQGRYSRHQQVSCCLGWLILELQT
jgi:hypothetical protein